MNTRNASFGMSVMFWVFAVFATVCPAWAHDLELFAAIDSGQVRGSVTYDDRPAPGVHIQILDRENKLLGETQSDNTGAFEWTPHYRTSLHLIADTAEGHHAEAHLSSDELPLELPAPPPGITGLGTVPTAQPADMDHQIEHLIEDAVSRQIYPLRQQLDALERRIRFRDVLGGIGYILGLFGVVALVKSRKSRPVE